VHRSRIVVLALLLAVPGFARQADQPNRLPKKMIDTRTPAAVPPAGPSAQDEATVDSTRRQLMEHLRQSPRLSEVLSRDASLLGDGEYIQRKNPELAAFLQQHPEVVRNPEFYLFGGRGGERLDDFRFNVDHETQAERMTNRLMNDVGPVIAILIFLFTGVWLVRLVMDNLRWKRVVRLQTDVHNKLLDKFGNSQELLAYMQTDAGKRFLDGSPISVALGSDAPQWGSPIARILRPLQTGIIVTAAGVGLICIPYEPLFSFGRVVLMVGIGFIISAGASWLIARSSGLLSGGAYEDSNRAS
jgi:uncharacterized protein YneF (UPF0154 family)